MNKALLAEIDDGSQSLMTIPIGSEPKRPDREEGFKAGRDDAPNNFLCDSIPDRRNAKRSTELFLFIFDDVSP